MSAHNQVQPRPLCGVSASRVLGGAAPGGGVEGVTPQRAQLLRRRRIRGIEHRQSRGQNVQTFAAVPARLADTGRDRVHRGSADLIGVVCDENVGQPGFAALFAAVDGPDERVVARVEFLDAGFLFDDGGPVEPDAGLRRHDQTCAQPGGDTHPAEGPDSAGDDSDHRCQRPQIQQGRTDLGDSVEPEVGFLKPHAAGLEQDHRGGRGARAGVGRRQGEGLGDLGSGDLTGAAALEALLDGAHDGRVPGERSLGDDRAVIGLRRHALRRQPRGFEPREGIGQHPHGSAVQQCLRAPERVEFDEAVPVQHLLPAEAGQRIAVGAGHAGCPLTASAA